MSITIQAVSKHYGKAVAIRDVSASIPSGILCGVFGPNGAGKSTLINMIATIIRPTSGDILWCGTSVYAQRVLWKKLLGVVLEDLCLFEYLTLQENLVCAGAMYGLSNRESNKRSDELLEYVSLSDVRGILPKEASAGMRKKLAFILSVIHAPRVLILDEVFSGIDPVSVQSIRDLLIQQRNRGMTIILATHLIETIERVIDRVLYLVDGNLVTDCELNDLIRSGNSLKQLFLSSEHNKHQTASDLLWLP